MTHGAGTPHIAAFSGPWSLCADFEDIAQLFQRIDDNSRVIDMKPFSTILALLILAGASLSGCAGDDYTPVYFPPPGDDEGAAPAPSVSTASRQCTLSFTSRLCVAIKGDKLEVGADESDPLCAEVPAFPIHVSGTTLTLNGSEFPDINVEGHGLPAPITINARGIGDGAANAGQGTVDASGNMTIEDFSLFIVALGIEGEVPGLTLTTGSTDKLEFLPSIAGSPPDASGAMKLVTATTLGHVIDAADEYLKGASLTATFTGSISPPLSECGGEGERSVEVKRVDIAQDGHQTESPLPDEQVMEVSGGTYISDGSADVGPRYETTTSFKVKNIGAKPQKLAIPTRKGPFYLSAMIPLTGTLAAQQSFVLKVTFRPTQSDSNPGKMAETLSIGSDSFQLTGVALSKAGSGSVSIVDDSGNVTAPDVSGVPIGSSDVPANAERRFFLCTAIKCGESNAWTGCGECADPATMPCELLSVSTSGRPLAEVDASCNPIEKDAAPLYTIDLKGSSDISLAAHKQVLALRNMGVADMSVASITLEEEPGSKSTGQFSLPSNAIFVADHFSDIQKQVAAALADKAVQGTPLPITLPPFQPGYKETTAYVVITYTPTDLMGSDGQQAGVGSKVTDKAILKIKTDKGDITSEISGTTEIKESPALELYFRTSSGTKQVAAGEAFPFKGITAATVDMASPLFLRTADTSSAALRVTAITLGGPDAANFRWLDTKEKIAQVSPPSGKGLRCSIPIVDESTGNMTGESFDLNPVQIGGTGFDLAPGAYSTATMPLFGCVDFHRDEGNDTKKLYEGSLSVEAVELTAAGLPEQNPDGSPKKTVFTVRLLAAIEPLSGQYVLRITQTMAAILNPQFPGLSAVSSRQDATADLASGKSKQTDLQVFTSAMILDPFDEMTIKSADGKKTISTPNDGVTAVFRAVDTHPVSQAYGVDGLFDYANLIYDGSRPSGSRGIFEDYPGVPDGMRANGWRIFTSTLSWPGPLGAEEKKPSNPSDCLIVDPCDPEGLRAFTDAGAAEKGKGACAFFYASGGRFDSPAFHSSQEMPGGEYANLCSKVDQPQNLYDMDTGHCSVDGSITFEETGLRFFGPTIFNNPNGQAGPKPPMDAIFHLAFTTSVLKPASSASDWNVLPDARIDLAKNEYKINLNDKSLATPQICESNTQNRVVGGKKYSTWRYLDGLLWKDEEGKIPAGCPETGNDFTGGQAFLRGKSIDPATGILTVITAAKFGSSDDLTFAFKDVMMFVVLKGWLCDPAGNPEEFEGARCYDSMLNDRDAKSQQSIVN